MNKHTLCGLWLALPTAAVAQATADVGGFVDLYVIPSANVEFSQTGFGSADDDGDGFGLRGMGPVAESVFLSAEYQATTYDDSNIDIDQLRFGVGLGAIAGGSVQLEYIDIELDGSGADGFGLHGRLASPPGEGLSLFGQIGYIELEDDTETISGFEGSVGLALQINEGLGGFLDYRVTALEGDNTNIDFDFRDWRLGLRLGF